MPNISKALTATNPVPVTKKRISTTHRLKLRQTRFPPLTIAAVIFLMVWADRTIDTRCPLHSGSSRDLPPVFVECGSHVCRLTDRMWSPGDGTGVGSIDRVKPLFRGSAAAVPEPHTPSPSDRAADRDREQSACRGTGSVRLPEACLAGCRIQAPSAARWHAPGPAVPPDRTAWRDSRRLRVRNTSRGLICLFERLACSQAGASP